MDEIQKIQGFVDDIATIHFLQSRISNNTMSKEVPKKGAELLDLKTLLTAKDPSIDLQ